MKKFKIKPRHIVLALSLLAMLIAFMVYTVCVSGKYSYTENWDREVNENYLPLKVEALLHMIPEEYEIVYSEHYVLPYVKQQIKRDSGIDLKDATHFKILLKRK